MNLALTRFAPFLAGLLLPASARSRAGSPALPAGAVAFIPKGAFLRLPKHARTATVSCLSGCLWTTLDNDPTDIVIAAGESYSTQRADIMLVFALEASSAVVS